MSNRDIHAAWKYIRIALQAAAISKQDLSSSSWTLAILEDLKPKAHQIRIGNLKWVLSTAMPLKADFQLFLNGENIESSKENYEIVAEFDIAGLSPDRIKALNARTGDNWRIKDNALISDSFAEGVSGRANVLSESRMR